MKAKTFSLLFALFLALTTAAAAEPSTLMKVGDQHIDQLKKLHAAAEQKLVVDDFRGAIQIYQDAILLEPDDEAAYTSMGHAYLILGDVDRAKDAFMNALAIDPDNETARMGLQKINQPEPLTSD